MCGRYSLLQFDALQDRYQTQNGFDGVVLESKEIELLNKGGESIQTNNIAPGQIVPVIVRGGANKDERNEVRESAKKYEEYREYRGREKYGSVNRIEMMKWGLVPYWAKDPRIGYKMINARVESISEKPAFRAALKMRRCIIPCSGFYEWQPKEQGKQPYYIHLKDRAIFSLAGLYEIWKDAEGQEWKTYTIITTDACNALKNIHDRMPIILNEDDEKNWLDCEGVNQDRAEEILKSSSCLGMEIEPILSLQSLY